MIFLIPLKIKDRVWDADAPAREECDLQDCQIFSGSLFICTVDTAVCSSIFPKSNK